jgi:hypothetical protein
VVACARSATARLGRPIGRARSLPTLQREANLVNRASDDGEDRPHFRLEEGADGIVRLTWDRDLRVTAELAKRAMAAVDAVNAGRRRPLLVCMARTTALDREARAQFGEKTSISAMALLGETPVDRLLAASTLGRALAQAPARYFTDEGEAVAWLLETGRPSGG